MPNTNFDIITTIAQFIEPNPVVYTRLAMVNKDFYRIFTSDKLWAALDVYDWRTDIFQHFLKKNSGHMGLIKLYWCFSWKLWDEFIPPTGGENLYIYLGYIVHLSSNENINVGENLIELALDLKRSPEMYRRFPHRSRDAYDKAILACPTHTKYRKHLPLGFTKNDDFLKGYLKYHENDLHQLLYCNIIANLQERYQILPTLWEVSPSKYVEVLFFQYYPDMFASEPTPMPDMPEFWETLRDKITNRATAVVALEGNGQCLHKFPEYAEDFGVIMPALDTLLWQKSGIPFLANNPNHELVAKVLDAFPQLLYAAPQSFQSNKERLIRFLEQAPFIHYLGSCKSKSALKLIFDNITESTWADPEVAGQIVDLICTSPEVVTNRMGLILPQPPAALCDDLEWIKKRILLAPKAWSLASDRLKGDRDLVLYGIESIESFSQAPEAIRQRNRSLGERLPHLFDTDYKLLKRLFSVVSSSDKEAYTHTLPLPIAIIKAMIAPSLDMRPGLKYHAHSEDSIAVKELEKEMVEQVRDEEYLEFLKSNKDKLGMLWLHPCTARFARDHLGSPPSDSVDQRTKDIEAVSSSLDDACFGRFSPLVRENAIAMVSASPGSFNDLPQALQTNHDVLLAMQYGRKNKHRRPANQQRQRRLYIRPME